MRTLTAVRARVAHHGNPVASWTTNRPDCIGATTVSIMLVEAVVGASTAKPRAPLSRGLTRRLKDPRPSGADLPRCNAAAIITFKLQKYLVTEYCHRIDDRETLIGNREAGKLRRLYPA